MMSKHTTPIRKVQDPAGPIKKKIVRTPEVLGPLIEQDLRNAEKAGLQYYLAVGAKLNEVRLTLKGDRAFGEFRLRWCPHLEPEQCERYQRAAKRYAGAPPTDKLTLSKLSGDLRDNHQQKKLEDVLTETDAEIKAEEAAYWAQIKKKSTTEREPLTEEKKAAWKAQWEANASRMNAESRAVNAIRDLAITIIQSGFRTLSKAHHPDVKGGNSEAQAKLAAARDWAMKQIKGA